MDVYDKTKGVKGKQEENYEWVGVVHKRMTQFMGKYRMEIKLKAAPCGNRQKMIRAENAMQQNTHNGMQCFNGLW